MEIFLSMKPVIEKIVKWLRDYADSNNMQGFVIGISGGIDSAVVSTLCAETGLPTLAVSIPINQIKVLDDRSEIQKNWLKSKYSNVTTQRFDLSETFENFKKHVPTN